jgi:hypothetical protein
MLLPALSDFCIILYTQGALPLKNSAFFKKYIQVLRTNLTANSDYFYNGQSKVLFVTEPQFFSSKVGN